MKKRIYYHDTDCGGIVYYGNFLKYFEEARSELLENAGFSVKDLSEKGILFVVARQEVDYKLPACYGDMLDIKATVSEVGRSKMVFEYTVANQAAVPVAAGKTVMVCVNAEIKPRPIPVDLKERLANAK